MNKLLKSFALIFLALALVLGLGACKQEPAQEHVHTFSETWTTDGQYHWHAATCEHTDQVADKAAHTLGTPTVKAATCLEAGSSTSTCSVCGATVVEIIPALGHTYSTEWAHDEAYHWHVSSCEHTGLKGSFEPHTWDSSEVITPSTCDAEGTIRYTCKCGATKDEALPRHTFASAWTSDDTHHWHAATCEHTEQVSEKSEHDWGTAVVNGNGTGTYTCKICGKQVTKDLPDTIRMVTAGPGEDSSNSAVISWHAFTAGSSLEYRTADSEEWTVVPNSACNEALSTADWKKELGKPLDATPFRCKVYLEGLTPGTTYKYRIKTAGSEYSDVATFKTAEADSTYFQFMWLSDLHTPKGGETYINRVGELVDFAQAKDGVDLDFVLFTGDMVNKGQMYQHWNYWSDSGLMNDLTYAFVIGNHDYYGYNNSTRVSNTFYMDVAAYPDNATEGTATVLGSNYWFIWNRVLFVCVDTMTEEGQDTGGQPGSSLSAQQAWFKAVVDANAGNYDYLIFAQHYPWFNSDTAPCDYGNFNSWYKIFDQYKVDFALSSDEHHYRRTYALYNKRNPDYYNEKNPTAEKAELIDGKVSKGTVYAVSNLTEGSSVSSLRNTASQNLKYVEYSVGGVGGVYFTVTPTEMTLHQIGSGGKEYDTITVLKKSR